MLQVGQVWVGSDGIERKISILNDNFLEYIDTSGRNPLKYYWTLDGFKRFHEHGGYLKNSKPITINKRHLRGL